MPFFLLLLFFFLPLFGEAKYYLSIGTMFQNEGRFLKEWIEYHRLLGVEHFYLYNNNSSDNYQEVLDPYIKAGIVELIFWPSPPSESSTPYQMNMIKHVLKKATKMSHWVALIDVDEFIVPRDYDSLPPFLRAHEQYGAVAGMWRFFGTSGVERIPEGELLVETLNHRTPFVRGEVWLHKSIVKPEAVAYGNIHDCALRPGHQIKGYVEAEEEYPPLLIYHYWTRDIDFFKNVKVERERRLKNIHLTEEQIETYCYESFNQVEDVSMMRFVPALRRRVFP